MRLKISQASFSKEKCVTEKVFSRVRVIYTSGFL